MVILFTALSTTGADRYVKAHLKSDSSYIENPISPEEFDGLIENRHGVLPIRFFTLKTPEHALQKAGLRVLDHYVIAARVIWEILKSSVFVTRLLPKCRS